MTMSAAPVLRGLARDPIYAVAVIVIVATAVAVNGAVFTAVRAVLLQPLPITAPGEVVVGWGSDPERGLPLVEFSYRNIADWSAISRHFTSIGAMGSSTWPATLLGHGAPRRIWSTGVSGSFFDTLGVAPLLGRPLGPADDAANAPPVAVISHRLWLSAFGGASDVIGKPLRLDGGSRTIVGVMPAGMDLPRGTDFWMPVVPVLTGADQSQQGLRNVGVLFLVGRLAPGVAVDHARRDLDAIGSRVEREQGTPRFGTRVVLTPLHEVLFGPVRTVLWVALAAVVVIAATAASNVVTLLLARVSGQRAEDAVRLAIGASSRHLIGRWLLESVLLGVVGGAVGVAACWLITHALVALAPADLFRLQEIRPDWRIAIGTVLVTAAVAMVAGMTVGWTSAGQEPACMLGTQARHSPGRAAKRTRGALVVFQIACAGVLLVGAGLLARSFVRLRQIDPGFTPRGAAVLRIEPRGATDRHAWMDDLLTRVNTRGDLVAGSLYLRPLGLGAIGQEVGIRLHGQTDASPDLRLNPSLNYQIASVHTFRALGVPVTRGRAFLPTDDARAPRVAIVGESAARRLWPGLDAVGQRIAIYGMPPDDDAQRWRTVVGVVADVRYRGIRDVRLDFYDAALQAPTTAQDVVIRTAADPATAAAAAIAEARRMDPDVLIDAVTTLEAIVERATAPWRFGMTLLAVFAAAAVLIGAGGLFAVVMLETTQAEQELAIRTAVGARPRTLLRLVLGRAVRRALVGTAAGLIGAALLAPYLRGLLVDVTPFDILVYAGASGVLVLLACAASLPPALRAARADPVWLMRRRT